MHTYIVVLIMVYCWSWEDIYAMEAHVPSFCGYKCVMMRHPGDTSGYLVIVKTSPYLIICYIFALILDGLNIFKVSTATSISLSHWILENPGSHLYKIDSTWLLNVCITLSPDRALWLPAGTIWYFKPHIFISLIRSVENSLSIWCRIGVIPMALKVD